MGYRPQRILRFLVGADLVVLAWPSFRDAASNRILAAVLVVVGLTAFCAVIPWSVL